MSIEGQRFYPGETASAQQVAALAHEYRIAADALLSSGRRGKPISRAPFRLVAIHAIELYLNAMLLASGHAAVDLRRMHHDLASRTRLAVASRLNLRGRTLTHLLKLSETREYLTTRYDPEAAQASELNRMAATLAEVATKVTAFIHRADGRGRTPTATASPTPLQRSATQETHVGN